MKFIAFLGLLDVPLLIVMGSMFEEHSTCICEQFNQSNSNCSNVCLSLIRLSTKQRGLSPHLWKSLSHQPKDASSKAHSHHPRCGARRLFVFFSNKIRVESSSGYMFWGQCILKGPVHPQLRRIQVVAEGPANSTDPTAWSLLRLDESLIWIHPEPGLASDS